MSDQNEVISYAIRMVVLMRHEFNRNVNVTQLLEDAEYARSILTQAATSRDARLREYAAHIAARLPGPRAASAPVAAVRLPAIATTASPPAASPPAASPPAAAAGAPPTAEDILLQRMRAKYTQGLR